MTKNTKNIKFITPILLVVFSVIINLSCQDDLKEAVPNVTSVRYTAPDSIAPIDTVGMGATIAIQGTGLRDVQKVRFNSVELDLNPNYVTDNNIIVNVPGEFPSEITNQVCLITASDKEYCFDFEIIVPGPEIVEVVYILTGSETPDIIRLQGYAFAQIQGLYIGTPSDIDNNTGQEITDYQIFNNNTILTYNVPADFSFEQSEIKIVTVAGTDQVSNDWEAALTPRVYGISNEYAMIGDTTAILGQNLATIESLTFGGLEVTEYWESDDYTTLYFLVPDGATPGQTTVTATNTFGEVSTSFRYAEADQMIMDFDDSIANWPVARQTEFDMLVINEDTNRWGYVRGDVNPSWWDETTMYCRNDTAYPVFSEPDAINNLAFKFEINVKKPWIGGGLCRFTFMQFVPSLDDFDEVFNYHWIPGYTEEVAYTTDGWLTVTIPISDFDVNENYTSEFDITGLRDFRFRFYHDGNQTTPLADMDVNIDNFRLVTLE